MKRINAIILAFSLAVTAANAAVTLTNFGTTTSQAFTLSDTSGFTVTPGATQLTVSGNDSGSFFNGTFASTNIVGLSSSLTLTGSVAVSAASAFTLTLFDSAFNTANYVGGSWSALSSGSTTLNFDAADSGFNFANVIGVQLSTSGAPPGSTVTATLTGLGVVPEPTRALLLGVGLMGLMMRRRR